MAMVVGDIAVLPRGGAADDPIALVDLAIGVIQASGLNYEVDAMSTVVEGEFDEVMDLYRRVHRAVMEAGADRLITIMRVDEKIGGVSIGEKISRFR